MVHDTEFSIDAIDKHYKSTYVHEAKFYDLQPTSLKVSWKQRTR
jgi:cellulose synthase/poly-beta-1,6-N-acetylglucosamine synthase-like glycosyltransferase